MPSPLPLPFRFLPVLLPVLLPACSTTSPRVRVQTDRAPAAIGPYSQAIQVGNALFLAGQIGMSPKSGQLVAGGVEAETEQALRNIQAVLESRGFGLGDVVQAQVFLADLADYARMNAVYSRYFQESPPARAAVQVARLPRDARIEIMVTALR